MTTPARAGASALLTTDTSFRRQRLVLLISLAAVVVAAWAYLWSMAGPGPGATGGVAGSLHAGASHPSASTAALLGWSLLMWSVMAIAMMLPTSVPLLQLFTRYWRAKHPGRNVVVATATMAAGYLTAWLVFAAVAAGLQWGFGALGLLTPGAGALRASVGAGGVLVLAGVYQLTPLKNACLRKCRSPMMFLNTRWREGRLGPFLMGVDDGAFCLGCCWALMLVMFVTGVMNLLWMAILTLVMGAEKIAPRGPQLARVVGCVLLVAGIWTVFAP